MLCISIMNIQQFAVRYLLTLFTSIIRKAIKYIYECVTGAYFVKRLIGCGDYSENKHLGNLWGVV